MKKLLFLLIIVLGSLSISAQQYKLLPDSCTYCFYQNYTFLNGFYTDNYEVDITADTIINGKLYDATVKYFNWRELYIRQEGDKVYGVPIDSINEYLIMDFETQVGDTIFNLLSADYDLWFYDVIVLSEDSLIMGDGSYHSYRTLGLFNAESQGGSGVNYGPGNYELLYWQEKGLCYSNNLPPDSLNPWPSGEEGGGYICNVIQGLTATDHSHYHNPTFCTTDTLVPTGFYGFGNVCHNCIPVSSSVNEYGQQLIQVYPNPASSQINLHSSSLGEQQLSICSLSGNLIEAVSFREQYTLDVKHYPEGFYVYVCTDEFGIQTTGKIIVDR